MMTHGLHHGPTYHQPHYSSSDIAAHHSVWPGVASDQGGEEKLTWSQTMGILRGHYCAIPLRHAGLTSAIVSNANSAMAANKTLGTQGTACHCDTILMVVK